MEAEDNFNKSQRVVSVMGSPPTPQTQPNPSKCYWHFLSKGLLVTVLLFIVPLFPSQAPEFVNQSVLTRSWELFHLLFVGIAVSYGLFSRRNVETEKENQSKIDSAQNFVSRILQVSPVFDDDVDGQFAPDDNHKVQTWNSRYSRGEPMLVVEEESSVADEKSRTVTKISNKPLLLPVRSLKSRVSDSDTLESPKESCGFSRSSSASRISSNGSFRSRNGDMGAVDPLDLKERLQENVVLPSPIPWRSRSGRMEMKEEFEAVTPPPYSLPPSADETEIERDRPRSFRSSSWSSRTNSASPSPRKLSPSPSLSPELRAKTVEDSIRKKNYYTSCPPPPPPPPPPVSRKSPLITSNFNPVSNGYSSENMGVRKSFKDELKDLSRSSREDLRSMSDHSLETLRAEVKSRVYTEGTLMAQSTRAIRGSEPSSEARKAREYGEEQLEDRKGKGWKEVERMFMTKQGRRAGGFDRLSMNTENPSQESCCPIPKSPLSKYQMEEKKESHDKVIVEADEDSDGEPEAEADSEENSDKEAVSNTGTDGGVDSEVDKKAAEFIAKFREQIRLQRIESIKKASGKVRNRASSQ